LGGVVENRFPDGQVKTVTSEQIGLEVAYLRCGMYPGIDGGTPEENFYHGLLQR
jgi:hypothetical protein